MPAKIGFNGGKYYSIPQAVLEAQYHGCGNGFIIVDKATDEVVSMNYDDGGDGTTQNIVMSPLAGEVMLETETNIVYRANFSCCQACLF